MPDLPANCCRFRVYKIIDRKGWNRKCMGITNLNLQKIMKIATTESCRGYQNIIKPAIGSPRWARHFASFGAPHGYHGPQGPVGLLWSPTRSPLVFGRA